MPLRLNLYHEIEKKKALKRRDPLKISIASLIAVAVGFAGYYFYQLGVQSSLSSELAGVQSEYNSIAAKAEIAQKRADEMAATLKTSETLVKRIEGRFYWAPVLETLAQSVPRDVQITRLAGEVASEGTKRCSLTVDGLAAGAEPRKVAEDLRRILGEKFATKFKEVTSTFRSLEDSPEMVKLDGAQLPTATFAITIQMQTEEEPAPVAGYEKKK